MSRKKIVSVIGARPQFIKHAPMQIELQKRFDAKTLHTGQHYDDNMSKVFFTQLGMSDPDYRLELGNQKLQGEQTALMMIEVEKILREEKPDAVLLYGDTNSTLAGAIVASKMHVPIIHIEAGLRSYNKQMPEEINRIITDSLSSLLFCPTEQAVLNLRKENIIENVYRCGDVMCDILHLVKDTVLRKVDEPYYFATIHRPYNTDNQERLSEIVKILNTLDKKVYFSIHPRTLSLIEKFGIDISIYSNIKLLPPLGYSDSVSFQKFADAIITDSGGMQKEAYMLGVKCITIRTETEWVETLVGGWNTLVFENLQGMTKELATKPESYVEELYGDGRSSNFIADKIYDFLK